MQPVPIKVHEHDGVPLLVDKHHPEQKLGPVVGLYVWNLPMRLFHWGLVLSLGVLSLTGYYIHNPFIVGQAAYPFLMADVRFLHETCGMTFIALFLMRTYLFFQGTRWERWRAYVPLHHQQWLEMINVARFYSFISRKAVSKIGHNAMAAATYLGIYALVVAEILSGLVLFNALRHSSTLGFFVGWIPYVISIQNIRLIHFFLMFIFICFGIVHIHLSMLISRVEKRGLMDSIFIGYKVIPESEVLEEEKNAEAER